MTAVAGYPWTVIPVSERKTYIDALEKASVDENVEPFAALLAKVVGHRLIGSPLPAIPVPLCATLKIFQRIPCTNFVQTD
jgi:hypothetical protein